MIGRLLRTAANLSLLFCAATLLAELIILGYLWGTWQLNREKLIQMLAIAQGVDLFAAQQEAQSDLEEVAPEEPSYQQWRERRATMFRDLELREQAMENGLAQLRFAQQQLADERKAQQQLQQRFEARLLALQQGAQAEGRETVGRILESLKPKQAKEQILQMLDHDEIHEVVVILKGMTESKRAKILAEFKLDEENKKVAEVLRLIRQGEPRSSLVDETAGQLQATKLTGT